LEKIFKIERKKEKKNKIKAKAMRAKEFIKEDPIKDPGAWPRLWTDGDGGGSIDWQSKFKSKYGVDLPSDAVIASGISGKKLPDLGNAIARVRALSAIAV
jgi:hypothetical protein